MNYTDATTEKALEQQRELVILTKRATRAAGRISDSGA
jgi:hypothetical protein